MSMRRYPHRAPVATLMVAFVTIAAVVLGLTMATGANAGTYVIDNCPSAPTGNGNAGPWTVFGASQNTIGSCSGGPGSWIGPEGASMPPTGAGDLDGVQVVVPAGSAITIREAKLWWYVPHQNLWRDDIRHRVREHGHRRWRQHAYGTGGEPRSPCVSLDHD